MIDDRVRLVTGGNEISGWQEVRITRGIERIPVDFAVTMTDPIPGIASLPVAMGDAQQIFIGDDLVCTGFVDRVSLSIGPGRHDIAVAGRGRCADLVDCSAVWQGGQWMNATLATIATELATPFSVQVVAPNTGEPFPQYNLQPGESPFSVIEKLARVRGQLAYEDEQGRLVIGQCGTGSAQGAIVQGSNVESATLAMSMDQRYSDYIVIPQGIQLMLDNTGGQPMQTYSVQDKQVTRYRPRYMIPEGGDALAQLAQTKCQWEANRRLARGYILSVTVDDWRDRAGVLWTPNTLVNVQIPAIKANDVQWLIGEVTYRLGRDGRHADLIIMPADGFKPEPVLYQPIAQDTALAVR